MGQLLQLILDNLYKLWPFRVVDADQQGVKYTHKGLLELLPPGMHSFYPGWQRIEKVNVVYQQLECGVQSMETKDGISVSLSFNVGYTIVDAAAMSLRFQNFDHTLQLIARGKLGMKVHEYTYRELQEKLPEIAKDLLATLRNEVSGSGVRIKDVRPDEFGKSRLYRFIGSSQPLPI